MFVSGAMRSDVNTTLTNFYAIFRITLPKFLPSDSNW